MLNSHVVSNDLFQFSRRLSMISQVSHIDYVYWHSLECCVTNKLIKTIVILAFPTDIGRKPASPARGSGQDLIAGES